MKRALRRKYHYIYRTTCIVTDRFYIGMHSTDNLEDGYIGSGKRLWYSINKHGKENHVCEILEFLPDRSSLKAREKEIVNEELINEELCMNLQIGGGGGLTNEIHRNNFINAGINNLKSAVENGTGLNTRINRWNNDKLFRSELSKKLSDCSKGNKNWLGKSHTDETKQKIKESASNRKPEQNSQYGTCWITNEIESKKIRKGDLIPEGWKLGRKIKNKE